MPALAEIRQSSTLIRESSPRLSEEQFSPVEMQHPLRRADRSSTAIPPRFPHGPRVGFVSLCFNF